MKSQGIRITTCLLVVAAGIFGCAENPGPMAPPQELSAVRPSFDHGEIVDTEVTVLERNHPLDRDYVASRTIGPNGGEIKLEEAGIHISFPAGALTQNTDVKVIARAGRALVYEFYPSPLSFLVPVKIEQDLRPTAAYRNETLMNQLKAAYFPGDALSELRVDGAVKVTELLPVGLELKTSKISFFVHHFSGYLVASGRSGEM